MKLNMVQSGLICVLVAFALMPLFGQQSDMAGGPGSICDKLGAPS